MTKVRLENEVKGLKLQILYNLTVQIAAAYRLNRFAAIIHVDLCFQCSIGGILLRVDCEICNSRFSSIDA